MPSFSSPSNGDLLHHLFINLYYTGIFSSFAQHSKHQPMNDADVEESLATWKIQRLTSTCQGNLANAPTSSHKKTTSVTSTLRTNFLNCVPTHPHPVFYLISGASKRGWSNNFKFKIQHIVIYISFQGESDQSHRAIPLCKVSCSRPPHGFAPEATHNFPGDSLEQHIALHITQQKYWIHF